MKYDPIFKYSTIPRRNGQSAYSSTHQLEAKHWFHKRSISRIAHFVWIALTGWYDTNTLVPLITSTMEPTFPAMAFLKLW